MNVLRMVVACLAASGAASAALLPPERPLMVPGSIVVSDEQDGRHELRALIEGAPTLLLPAFTRCSGTCPFTAIALKEALAKSGTALNVVLFSFDDEDRSQDLRDFRERFALPEAWLLVRSSDGAATRAFLDDLDFRFMKASEGFDHPNESFVFSPRGKWAATFAGASFPEQDLRAALDRALSADDPTTLQKLRAWLLQPASWIAVGCAGIASCLAVILVLSRSSRGRRPPRPATKQLPMHAPLHPGYSAAPMLRREPFRLLFPLGVLLAWLGVLHWLLFAVGATTEYRSIFHSLAQIEGFLACFASGFLFTFVPRRTRSTAASALEVALAAALPLCTVAFAWTERWAISQVFWIAQLVLLAQFALRRVRGAPGSVPPAFVWVPVALLCGIGGAVLAGVGAARGDEGRWLHDVGRGLVLQGVFTGLVLGTGGFLLPAITRGEAPPDGRPTRRDRLLMLGHLLLAAALIASFWIEQLVSVRSGFALRAAASLLALAPARPWLLPALPGLHRRIAWLAQWMLPLGYAFVAAVPEHRRIGLHIVFIGCFAALVLAVSIHVTLSHSRRAELLHRTPKPLVALASLLAVALAARLLVDLDHGHLLLWIGVAATAFLAASLAWAATLLAGCTQPVA